MAFRCSVALAVITTVLVGGKTASAEHVYRHGKTKGSNRTSKVFLGASTDTAEIFRHNLHQAVESALGAGHDFSRGHLGKLRESLRPMWMSLAKNEHDRIDRRSLRYAVHRYLLKTRSISITGLEPLQHGWSSPDAPMLTIHAPSYIKSALDTSEELKGFSLDDMAAMVAMLEELVAHAGYERLATLFEQKSWDTDSIHSDTFMLEILRTYMVRWIIGNDAESIAVLESDSASLRDTFEDWNGMVDYVKGLILAFERTSMWRSPTTRGANHLGDTAWHPLRPEYSYADVQSLTGEMSLSFGSFWYTECARVKDLLISMDTSRAGRVRLSNFHAAALNGEWRFSESRDYLRQLGALDESSDMLGPRVIIANYLQSASNCIVGDAHYRVCCADDCESYMSEIEEEVRSPTASPEQILAVVERMVTSLNDDQPKISSSLRSQLVEIANTHQGNVIIHGRLFAQWMHFTFPQDCAFPHKAGTVTSATPLEFGTGFMVTTEELKMNAANVSWTDLGNHTEVGVLGDWMTQWSEEEELVSSNLSLKAPWETRFLHRGAGVVGAAAFAAIGAAMTVQKGLQVFANRRCAGKDVAMWPAKAHFV